MGRIGNIENFKILEELRNYNPSDEMEKKRTRLKAYRVYRKCKKAGKLELAQKIFEKYIEGNIYDCLRKDDSVMAFGMMLMATKNMNK